MYKVFNTFYGKKKLISEEKMIKRLCMYGIVVNKSKILLIKVSDTDKYFFPGEVIEQGEKP